MLMISNAFVTYHEYHKPYTLILFGSQIIQYSMFLGDDWKILRISNNYFLNNEEKSKALYRIVPFHSFISLFRACFRWMLGLRLISNCSKTNYATLFMFCKKRNVQLQALFCRLQNVIIIISKKVIQHLRASNKNGSPCILTMRKSEIKQNTNKKTTKKKQKQRSRASFK